MSKVLAQRVVVRMFSKFTGGATLRMRSVTLITEIFGFSKNEYYFKRYIIFKIYLIYCNIYLHFKLSKLDQFRKKMT